MHRLVLMTFTPQVRTITEETTRMHACCAIDSKQPFNICETYQIHESTFLTPVCQ